MAVTYTFPKGWPKWHVNGYRARIRAQAKPNGEHVRMVGDPIPERYESRRHAAYRAWREAQA